MMMALARPGTTNVLLVDDNAGVREAVPRMINAWSGYRVVGTLASADGLVDAIIREQPDVVLLDIDMPGRSPFHAMEDLRYRGSQVKVIVLSALADEPTVRASFGAGANGYVLKEDAPESLREAMQAVLDGTLYLSPRMIGTL